MARKILSPASLRTLTRAGGFRFISSETKEPMCSHHKELVPCFQDVAKMKSFELKSDCASFHMKACGGDQCPPSPCAKSADPCEKFATQTKPKAKGPCPDDVPCKKWRLDEWPCRKSFRSNKLLIIKGIKTTLNNSTLLINVVMRSHLQLDINLHRKTFLWSFSRKTSSQVEPFMCSFDMRNLCN